MSQFGDAGIIDTPAFQPFYQEGYPGSDAIKLVSLILVKRKLRNRNGGIVCPHRYQGRRTGKEILQRVRIVIVRQHVLVSGSHEQTAAFYLVPDFPDVGAVIKLVNVRIVGAFRHPVQRNLFGMIEPASDKFLACEQMPPRPPRYIFRPAAGAFTVVLPVDVLKTTPLIAKTLDFFLFQYLYIFAPDLDFRLFLDDNRLIDNPDNAPPRQQIVFQRSTDRQFGIINIYAVEQRPFEGNGDFPCRYIAVMESPAHVRLGHAGEQCALQRFGICPENVETVRQRPDNAGITFVAVTLHDTDAALTPVTLKFAGLIDLALPVQGGSVQLFLIFACFSHLLHQRLHLIQNLGLFWSVNIFPLVCLVRRKKPTDIRIKSV